MIKADRKHPDFETDFEVWEKNRMYPPNHTGETMITVNDSHLKAIARAVHFVRSGMTKNMTPKMLSSIQHDIDLLDEAHKYIRQQIQEPGLPMPPCFVPKLTPKETDGTENSRPSD